MGSRHRLEDGGSVFIQCFLKGGVREKLGGRQQWRELFRVDEHLMHLPFTGQAVPQKCNVAIVLQLFHKWFIVAISWADKASVVNERWQWECVRLPGAVSVFKARYRSGGKVYPARGKHKDTDALLASEERQLFVIAFVNKVGALAASHDA